MEDYEIRTSLVNLITKDSNKRRITFEILEDEEVNDISSVLDFIKFSKEIGQVEVAIDDFGTGYSNYIRLLDFQPDYIKIDGSLIKDINEPISQSIIKSLILFAKENNIKTIAEFVSDEKTFYKVKNLGIDYSQGFYFGKPEEI